MAKVLVVSYCDNYYFDYILAMARSCEKNFSEARMLLYGINWSHEQMKMVSETSAAVCSEKVKFDENKYRINWIYRYRIELFCQLSLLDMYDAIYYVDSDTLFRAPCDGLSDHLMSCDITMRMKNKNAFAGSTIGFKPGYAASAFFSKFKDIIRGDHTTGATQYRLIDAYNEVKDNLIFKPIPPNFCSPWLDKGHAVWEGNGQKKMGKKWKKEMAKWL